VKGWRARLGFLIPPGNPTVEPELIAMTPAAITDRNSVTGARSSALTKARRRRRTPLRVGIRSIFGVHDHH